MYQVLEALMTGKKVNATQVCRDTGIPRATISDWKAGRSKPKIDKLITLADYFGVQPQVFLSSNLDSDVPQDAMMIANSISASKELQALFNDAVTANTEDIRTVHTMLKALKRKEK